MKSILINFLLISLAIVSINALEPINKCNCRSTVQSRILNGTKSVNVPWIAHIVYQKKLICTGFLVNEDFVLTSANCVHNKKPEDLRVIVGTDYLNTRVSNHNISVIKITKSDYFNSYDLKNGYDIAMLELQYYVILDEEKIELACMDFSGFKSDGDQTMMVVGLGMFEEQNLNSSDELRYAYFKENLNLSSSSDFIKAKAVVANKTIGRGDYGTPLMIQKNGQTRIVGIASLSEFEDGRYYTDNVWFSRLSQMETFIKNTVKQRYCH